MLVRAYPVALLPQIREALEAAQAQSFEPLQAVFAKASEHLEDLDPDEVRDPVLRHPEAGSRDKAAFAAALDVADTWEGIVAIAATIPPAPRFRGFLFACACLRYLDVDDPDLDAFKVWCRGQWLPGLGPEDSVLYAALPALIGLGPDLEDALPGPCPVRGERVQDLLGLPDEDWSGADPIDGVAISAEACKAAVEGAEGPWRIALMRGARAGLLVRRG